jgi:hypothetical protein
LDAEIPRHAHRRRLHLARMPRSSREPVHLAAAARQGEDCPRGGTRSAGSDGPSWSAWHRHRASCSKPSPVRISRSPYSFTTCAGPALTPLSSAGRGCWAGWNAPTQLPALPKITRIAERLTQTPVPQHRSLAAKLDSRMPRLQRRPLRVAYDDPLMASAMGWSQSRHPAPLAAAPRLQRGPGRVRAHRMARRGWLAGGRAREQEQWLQPPARQAVPVRSWALRHPALDVGRGVDLSNPKPSTFGASHG